MFLSSSGYAATSPEAAVHQSSGYAATWPEEAVHQNSEPSPQSCDTPKKLAAEVERASEHALPTCRVLIQFLVTRPAAGYSESVTQLTSETRSELGENIVQTGSPL